MAEKAIPTFHGKAKAAADKAADEARQMSEDAENFLLALDDLLTETLPN